MIGIAPFLTFPLDGRILWTESATIKCVCSCSTFGSLTTSLQAEAESGYPEDQVRRFVLILTVLLFRALKPALLTYLPVLSARVLQDMAREEVYLRFEDLIGHGKGASLQPFGDGFDMILEVDACRRIKDLIFENSFPYLSVIEMRLIAVCWSTFNSYDSFKWHEVTPAYTDGDKETMKKIMEDGDFDPFNERVQAIINLMRSDIITAQMIDEYAEITPYWTDIEFGNVVSVIRNIPIDLGNETELHAKMAILGKLTYQVTAFIKGFIELLQTRRKGRPLQIPMALSHLDTVPESMMRDSMKTWTNVSVRTCEEIQARMKLVVVIQSKVFELGTPAKTIEWVDYHMKKYLELILSFGVDYMLSLLVDDRYEFKNFLTESDKEFLTQDKKRRDLQNSGLPDYVFNERDLYNDCAGLYRKPEADIQKPFKPPSPPKHIIARKTKQKKTSRLNSFGDMDA